MIGLRRASIERRADELAMECSALEEDEASKGGDVPMLARVRGHPNCSETVAEEDMVSVFHGTILACQQACGPSAMSDAVARRLPRIHWVHGDPSPYMADLFDYLAGDGRIDLTVHYIYGRTGEHEWKQSFTEGHRSRIFQPWLALDWTLLRTVLREERSLFVFGYWADPTDLLGMLLCAAIGRKYAIFNDTPMVTRKRNRVKAAIRSAMLRTALVHAHATLATGKPAIAAFLEMGCPAGKLHNFPYFIDIDRFSAPDAAPRGEEPLTFFSSGRLIERKGYDLALKAFGKVFQAQPAAFQYRIAGTGPEEPRLRALAEKLGIANQVKFLGWLDPAPLEHWFLTSDVFVHPARWEPYGVCILEAMASGMVVVGSSATCAVVDRIVDGKNGFIHRTEDVEHLAEKIRFVVERRSHLQAIRQAARKTAEEWPVSRGASILYSLLGSQEAGA